MAAVECGYLDYESRSLDAQFLQLHPRTLWRWPKKNGPEFVTTKMFTVEEHGSNWTEEGKDRARPKWAILRDLNAIALCEWY